VVVFVLGVRRLLKDEELMVTLKIISSNPMTLLGLAISLVFIIGAFATWVSGDRILPYNPYTLTTQLLKPPSFSHLLGTDDLGRDVLSRVIAASPIDAMVAFSVVGLALLLGLFTGVIAGYIGGLLEEVVMRITDIFLAFPGLVLALAISAALGPSILHSIYALAPVWWPTYTRLARGETLSIKSQQFIEGARAIGQKDRYIILRHVIPNILPTMLVYATIDLGNVILVFSVLSFVGLGAQPPTPEWGLMVVQGEQYLNSAPWVPLSPALAILIVAIGFSLLGDGLRDALDPRIRGSFG
jgi:peptide/nickel transport system permease protein